MKTRTAPPYQRKTGKLFGDPARHAGLDLVVYSRRAPFGIDVSVLEHHVDDGLAVSRFSCWEIAKKVERGKLRLGQELRSWLDAAESAPGVVMLEVTRAVLVEATRLPGEFHRDPADQIIVRDRPPA